MDFVILRELIIINIKDNLVNKLNFEEERIPDFE